MKESSVLQLYRGPRSVVDTMDLDDGSLYFATDTKQIFLDCAFTDSEGTSLNDRLAFGGSSGIFYGNKDFPEGTAEFIFKLDDFTPGTTEEMPSINDLILNKDGSFFRVIALEEQDGEAYAKGLRLTVAGGGGGGPSGGAGIIYAKRSGTQGRNFSNQAKEMPLTFVMYSPDGEDVIVSMNVMINNVTVATIEGIRQSKDEQDVISYNFAPFVKYLGTNRSNTVKLSFVDDNNNISATAIQYSVRVVELQVSPANEKLPVYNNPFPYSCLVIYDENLTDPTTNTAAEIYWHAEVINKDYNRIEETFKESIAGIPSGNAITPQISYYGDGTYIIRSWLSCTFATGEEIKSNILEQTFIFQKDLDTPILMATFPSGEYDQYQPGVNVSYKIAYKNPTISLRRSITITTEKGIINLQPDILNEVTNTDILWPLTLSEVGSYVITLEILAGSSVVSSEASAPFTVKASGLNVPIVVSGATSGLVVDLRAKNRNNSEVGRDEWISEVGNTKVSCEFDNFNWISNGWKTEDSITSLHLNNGAKLIIPYSPFKGENNTAPTVVGRTIEMDIKINNVRDRFAHLIKCASVSYKDNLDDPENPTRTVHTGIFANGEAICLNSSSRTPIDILDTPGGRMTERLSGLVARYEEGSRVHITFVITPAETSLNANMPKHMVYTYINGVISGLIDYETDNFTQSNTVTDAVEFLFDSTSADIDIYNFRVYNNILSDRAVLQNYLASLGSVQEAAARWKDNGLLNKQGKISLQLVKDAGNIPYMVFRGGVPCDKKGKIKDSSSEIASLPGDGKATKTDAESLKKDYRLMDVYYVDPENANNNIASQLERTQMVVYPQGTSSMGYPVKNLRIKMIEGEYKDGYKLFDYTPPVNLFCLKADYMESSSANNTGTGNALNEFYGDLKTPAQIIDPNHVTAIVGRPIVCFFKPLTYKDQYALKDSTGKPVDYDETNESVDDYIYIGRYNFNLDKSTHEPFGFESRVDDHYGVVLNYGAKKSIMNMLDENLEAELKKLPLVAGFSATTDETYDPAKTYYIQPLKDEEGNPVSKYTVPAEDGSETMVEKSNVWTSSIYGTIKNPDDMTDKEEEALEDEFCGRLAISPLYEYHTAEEGVNSIQCWECLTNTSALTRFQTEWDEEADREQEVLEMNPTTKQEELVTKYYYDWTTAFESRYPEYAEEQGSDKRAFSVLVNWIASTNQAKVQHEPSEAERATNPNKLTPLFPDPADPTKPEKDADGNFKRIGNYYYDSKEYRLYKFITEFNDHMHRDFTLFYYILTELLIMMDSRAKNMMLCSFDANNDEGTGIWFPIFYDMDTACGLDNTGKLIYRYDEEDYFTGVYNSAAGYQDQYGKDNESYGTLWCNLREAIATNAGFRSDVEAIYTTLRQGRLTEENLVNLFNKEQANAWNETYINQDQQYKYIAPHLVGDTSTKLYAAQGTRSEFRSQFLRKRLAYLDSKYNFGENALNVTNGRMNKYDVTGNFDFEYTAADSTYIWYGFTNGDLNGPHMIREGEKYNFGKAQGSTNSETGVEEQEIFLYFLNNLSSLGDLSAKYFSQFTFNAPTEKRFSKTRELIMGRHGQPEYARHFDGRLKLLNTLYTNWAPFLEKLDVAYIPELSSLNLSENQYIKQVYAEGSSIANFSFPEGGILQEIYFPNTLTNLTIKNHPQLTTIVMEGRMTGETTGSNRQFGEYVLDENGNQIPDWSSVNIFDIEGCTSLDSKAIFKALNPSGLAIHLPDINWTFEGDELVATNGVVSRLPVLDKLLIQAGSKNEDPYERTESGELIIDPDYDENDPDHSLSKYKLAKNRTYVGGTIKLKNATGVSYSVDEVDLYDKYIVYYPNLKIEFEDHANNVEGYTFNAYNTLDALITGYPRKIRENEISTKFSFDACFKEGGEYYLAPISRAETNKYRYIFCGWNTVGLQTFSEDDYELSTPEENLAAAKAAALSAVVVSYDEENKEYALNGIDMNNVFSTSNKVFNLYPTFIAEIRSYYVEFDDGLGNGADSIFATQLVRFGDDAVTPDYVPSKTRLPDATTDPSKSKEGYISPFKDYGADRLGPITAATKFVARYYPEEDMRQIPSPASYFFATADGNGVTLTVNNNVKAAAITLPATFVHNGVEKAVVDFKLSSGAKDYVRRIFVTSENQIVKIGSSFAGNTVLEYVDFEHMQNLNTITSQAFQDNEKLYVDKLSESILTIGNNAFMNCPRVMITELPTNLNELGASAFYGCTGITNCDLSTAIVLKTIGQDAFNNCVNMTGENFPPILENIGANAFANCESLNLVLTAYSCPLVSIASSAFNSSKVTIQSLPDSLEIIQGTAFALLKSTNNTLSLIPGSVKHIGYGAFMGSTITSPDKKLTFNNPNIVIDDNSIENGYNSNIFTLFSSSQYTQFVFTSETSRAAAQSTNAFGYGITDLVVV